MTLCFTLVTFHSFAILLLGVVVCAVVASALPTGKLTLSSYCMHTETLHGCIVYLQNLAKSQFLSMHYIIMFIRARFYRLPLPKFCMINDPFNRCSTSTCPVITTLNSHYILKDIITVFIYLAAAVFFTVY